jgi:hypothetical protein
VSSVATFHSVLYWITGAVDAIGQGKTSQRALLPQKIKIQEKERNENFEKQNSSYYDCYISGINHCCHAYRFAYR